MLRGGGGGGARNSSEGRAMESQFGDKISLDLSAELCSCMTPPFANARILAGVQRNPAGETY